MVGVVAATTIAATVVSGCGSTGRPAAVPSTSTNPGRPGGTTGRLRDDTTPIDTTLIDTTSTTTGTTPPASTAATAPLHPSTLDARHRRDGNDLEGFSFSSSPLDGVRRAAMQGISMRAGCPVPFDGLRLVRVSHWDFDGRVQTGELVVAATVVGDVEAVFTSLYRERFPIRRMRPVEAYGRAKDPTDGADDFRSIEDDNTSAFNCRTRTGGGGFSEHSSGTAIDINPIENPYVTTTGRTSHAASVTFLDRSSVRPGMAVADGPLVRAFREVGWTWGGTWSDVKDLQHFSRNGR